MDFQRFSLCAIYNLGKFHLKDLFPWDLSRLYTFKDLPEFMLREVPKIMLFHSWYINNVGALCRWSFLLFHWLNARWFGTSNMWELHHQNLLEGKLLTLWVTPSLIFLGFYKLLFPSILICPQKLSGCNGPNYWFLVRWNGQTLLPGP